MGFRLSPRDKEDLVFDRAEAVERHLADVIAARAPGESMLAAIRRDYAEAVARAGSSQLRDLAGRLP